MGERKDSINAVTLAMHVFRTLIRSDSFELLPRISCIWVSFTDLDLHVAFVTVENRGHCYVSLHLVCNPSSCTRPKWWTISCEKSSQSKMRVVIDQTHLRQVRSLMPVHPEWTQLWAALEGAATSPSPWSPTTSTATTTSTTTEEGGFTQSNSNQRRSSHRSRLSLHR